MSNDRNHPYELGQAYLIRTVTMHLVGKVIAVLPQEIVMQDAACLADSGRFGNALKTGEVSEVEPFPDGPIIIGRGSVVDACRWNHDLLRKVK